MIYLNNITTTADNMTYSGVRFSYKVCWYCQM